MQIQSIDYNMKAVLYKKMNNNQCKRLKIGKLCYNIIVSIIQEGQSENNRRKSKTCE